MKVKFWGVCGSIARPLSPEQIEDKIKNVLKKAKPEDVKDDESIEKFLEKIPFHEKSTYGGNTACVQIFPKSGETIFVDAGSGLRAAGFSLLGGDAGKGKGTIHLFLSHTHWDHIQGFPFFVPHYIGGNTIKIYSCKEDILDRMRYQHDFKFFPIKFEDSWLSKKEGVILKEYEEYQIGSCKVIPKLLYHPADSYAFKFIDEDGRTVVYASDSEFGSNGVDFIAECSEFFKGADILIFDTQYTFIDTTDKLGWGHSSINTGIDFAAELGIKKLVLFHHEPTYNDEKIYEIKMIGEKYKEHLGITDLELIIAYEGLEIEI